jgi:putative transposase
MMPRIGTRKLHYMLRDRLPVGRDKLFKILSEENLLIRRRKKHVRTTNSSHWMRKYEDQAKALTVTRPEQLWVADITYMSTDEETIYLHLVTDAYSKQIMGYKLSSDLTAESTQKALEMAFDCRIDASFGSRATVLQCGICAIPSRSSMPNQHDAGWQPL